VRVDRERIFAAVANERRQIATLIDSLDDTQLATPSLCAGWDVKTVAAHLACPVADGFSVAMRRALRRGSLARAIDELARCRAQLPTAEIVTTLRQRANYPLSPPVFGPVANETNWALNAPRGGLRSPQGGNSAAGDRLSLFGPLLGALLDNLLVHVGLRRQ
jgi:hypothetical protein